MYPNKNPTGLVCLKLLRRFLHHQNYPETIAPSLERCMKIKKQL